MKNNRPQPVFRQDYQPPTHAIDTVDLHFDLGENETLVTSTLRMRSIQVGVPLVLNGEHLTLRSIVLEDRALSPSEYQLNEHSLTLPVVPAAFTLKIVTAISPEKNTALEGLYYASGLFCTQCEAHGFRKITYFLDRPDVMAMFTTTLVADKKRYPILLSNGNCVETRDLPKGRHSAMWQDPFKKPCYLFALVAGDLDCVEDHFITQSGRRVILRIYVDKGNTPKCGHAMAALKKSMRWDEEVYGREYDLDIFMIVAVNDFNMGAMENKGLNIFNAKNILADPNTATDVDYAHVEGVIAHEYFHNWTGNRVTCRDWFQLSLKEGLTVFRDHSFSEDEQFRAVTRIQNVNYLRQRQFVEDAGPLAHPVRPESYIEMNNFYTATVYDKGAEVIRMMETLLGKKGFRKGMDLYFERHDGQAVTCDDFVQAMQDANHFDLSQFRLWYSQAGTPMITIESHYDPARQEYTLTVQQKCPPTPGQSQKNPQHIPITMGLLDQHGREMPLQLSGESSATGATRVLEIKKSEEKFCFVNVKEKPVPSLLRDFSAPVKLHSPLTDAELLHLLAHDPNDFNRWEAGMQLASRKLLKLIEDWRSQRPLHCDPEILRAYEKVLTHPTLNKGLKAEILTLPSETYLGEMLSAIDVEALYQVRKFLQRELAQRLQTACWEQYQANKPVKGYVYSPEAVGQRAFRNVCLRYLMLNETPEAYALCVAQYQQSDNMTDRLAALRQLSQLDIPERAVCLADFYDRWQQEVLVVDKWLSLQAISELPNTLEQVKTLMSHPAFSIKNPNKVRALIGAFASGNFIRFHDKRGDGYQFLAEQVLSLNQLNPQIAASLMEPLTQWRRFADPWKASMYAAIEAISKAPALSANVYEIAMKTLQ